MESKCCKKTQLCLSNGTIHTQLKMNNHIYIFYLDTQHLHLRSNFEETQKVLTALKDQQQKADDFVRSQMGTQ